MTIRRQLPIVRPGCWQQHKQLVGTRPQGVPGLGGLVPGVPSSGLFPYENQPATGAARRHMKVTRASMWSSREAACACITQLIGHGESESSVSPVAIPHLSRHTRLPRVFTLTLSLGVERRQTGKLYPEIGTRKLQLRLQPLTFHMLFLIAASASFASSPSCTETVCPKPDCDCPKTDCPKPDHDGFLRPGCSSKIAANKTSTPMAGGTLCAPEHL